MKEVAELLNTLREKGIITHYALFGAVAQMRYTEAVATMDVDVLVALPATDDFVVLTPIYEFCSSLGYKAEGDAIRVGNWPVRFTPAFDELTTGAMQYAGSAEMDGIPVRVVKADYLAVIALSVGRNKDYLRILSLLESDAVTESQISALAEQHNLLNQWETFKNRFLDEK